MVVHQVLVLAVPNKGPPNYQVLVPKQGVVMAEVHHCVCPECTSNIRYASKVCCILSIVMAGKMSRLPDGLDGPRYP